jgi:hypothetical protein
VEEGGESCDFLGAGLRGDREWDSMVMGLFFVIFEDGMMCIQIHLLIFFVTDVCFWSEFFDIVFWCGYRWCNFRLG